MRIRGDVDEQIIDLGAGVHAYLQSPGGWCVSNAGVIAGGDGALVIDTLATESRARRLREIVDGLAPGPARTIVNTHHHGDHNFGNHEFGRAATVIAHEQARIEMQQTGLALTAIWPGVQWGQVRVTLPTVTFADRIAVHIGEHRVELIHVGPAHTTNDVVVWLPERRILFAGDVVMAGVTPFVLFGSISGSLEALAELRALEPETVIGGHGPIAGPEVLEQTRTYFEWVWELAAEGLRANRTPMQVARAADLGSFAHLVDSERIVANLHRAYDELRGHPPARPLDVDTVFGELIELNGGKLPTCLA
ncbi:MBL fold metallo-hydrolase [Nocardia sp. NBC_01388]|uniref:MBL fold metallo-hydrolase n=1 Tax=Nocardia sp. NBC_01388 TaxID=2903596 RepID=UPI003248C39F